MRSGNDEWPPRRILRGAKICDFLFLKPEQQRNFTDIPGFFTIRVSFFDGN